MTVISPIPSSKQLLLSAASVFPKPTHGTVVVPRFLVGNIGKTIDTAAAPTNPTNAGARLFVEAYGDLLKGTSLASSKKQRDLSCFLFYCNALFGAFGEGHLFFGDRWSDMRASVDMIRAGVAAIFPAPDERQKEATVRVLNNWSCPRNSDLPSPAHIRDLVRAISWHAMHNEDWHADERAVLTPRDRACHLTYVQGWLSHQLRAFLALPIALSETGLRDLRAGITRIQAGLTNDNAAARQYFIALMTARTDLQHTFTSLSPEEQTIVLSAIASEYSNDLAQLAALTTKLLDWWETIPASERPTTSEELTRTLTNWNSLPAEPRASSPSLVHIRPGEESTITFDGDQLSEATIRTHRSEKGITVEIVFLQELDAKLKKKLKREESILSFDYNRSAHLEPRIQVANRAEPEQWVEIEIEDPAILNVSYELTLNAGENQFSITNAIGQTVSVQIETED